jgi:hypothetical protein
MSLLMQFPGTRKKGVIAYRSVEVDPSKSDTDVSNHIEASASTIVGWPIGPQRVANAPAWLLADLLLLLMPISFIGEHLVQEKKETMRANQVSSSCCPCVQA